ncbi:MAG: deoxyribodipyrimidine photo-lyase [Bacteroidales bacterium]|nr:deoxyribodipyrimidine photo-lyase [Bacteroidales bacterium]
MKISVYWFRRDLRLEDNAALLHALESGYPVLPIFIFDKNILQDLPKEDQRLTFIYSTLKSIHTKLKNWGSSLLCLIGDPREIWEELTEQYEISGVYINKDYEPYAIERDNKVKQLLLKRGIMLFAYKDQVIFEESEVIKHDGNPYTVFTPYKNKWLSMIREEHYRPSYKIKFNNFIKHVFTFPVLSVTGFTESGKPVKDFNLSDLHKYGITRDYPSEETTNLGPHLRFGTVSIRKVISRAVADSPLFLSELIWREFFMQILFHFPQVVTQNFKPKYNGIRWRNCKQEFELWCKGNTGYTFVDAGMRQLNATGYMHNRVRMIAASFLCKHLLIDWRWGEAYFARKLIDYELSSNNGNWQWAAGTGCDAAPYFRIFNPVQQQKKFDKDLKYVKRWVPELKSRGYVKPVVELEFARARTLNTYKDGINKMIKSI